MYKTHYTVHSTYPQGQGQGGHATHFGTSAVNPAAAMMMSSGGYNPQSSLSGMTSSPASTPMSEVHPHQGQGQGQSQAQRSSSGSVLGSRTSRDRDMSDHAARLNHKHALPTPYADKNHMVSAHLCCVSYILHCVVSLLFT
jgi:hypothetical protein